MSVAPMVHSKVVELGKLVLRMTTAAGSGHPSSALSLLHTVVVLMYRQMRWDPQNPWDTDADRLVLSEGHAVPAIYAAYADLGGVVGRSPMEKRALTVADLDTLREAASVLDGHPNPAEGFPFFDAATGSLGQGLSVAAGLGLGARLRKSDRRIYTLIGDGESREGQIWEAVDFIADHRLTHVVAIFNCNGQGQADYVSKQQSPETIAAKLAAYNWDVAAIDGHDPDAIVAALGRTANAARPLGIVARTEKGWGVAALKGKSNHGKPLARADLPAAYESLDATRAALAPAGGVLDWRPVRPAAASAARKTGAAAPKWPSFAEAMESAGLSKAVSEGKLSTRRAYGAALLALGRADDRIVALDADVSNSTFSEMFGKAMPERFFECKIAEQNMISAAVGLAAAGFVPFVNSFAKFLARAYDQVEMAAISRANIKLVGSHAGVSLAADGPSQMSLPDVAFFRSLSSVSTENGLGCVYFQPADAVAAFCLTRLMAEHRGMCYMRTHRPDVGLIYKPDERFEIGGAHVLARGDAATIVTSGYMVHVCREAVAQLLREGVSCALIDAYAFPLREDRILAEACGRQMRYLCVEDNYGAGLGAAVAEMVSAGGTGRVAVMSCKRIPKSAKTPSEILSMTGLNIADIVDSVRKLVRA